MFQSEGYINVDEGEGRNHNDNDTISTLKMGEPPCKDPWIIKTNNNSCRTRSDQLIPGVLMQLAADHVKLSEFAAGGKLK
jgi:hypothetical protein